MPFALLLADDRDTIRRSRTRLRDRLAARMSAGRVDRALARGAAPDTDAALQLRARTLIGAPMRSMLADRLERLVREAMAGRRVRSSRVIPDRRVVLAGAAELEEIVGLLRQPVAVSPAGVARVVTLLADGTGPLYNPDAEPGLPAAASAAIAGLEAAGV